MTNPAEHARALNGVGTYRAPDDAKVTPVSIPANRELVEVLTGGEVFFDVDGTQRPFGKGTIFWHQAGEETIHRTTPRAPYRCVVFSYLVDAAKRPAPRVGSWNSEMDLDSFLSECLRLFHGHRLDKSVLCLYSYGCLLKAVTQEKDPHGQVETIEPLSQAVEFIDKNLDQPLAVEDIARRAGVSAPHLFKLFRKHMNMSPGQHLLSKRLAHARISLIGSRKSIKEIARESGFANLEVFYRRFRRESGVPPGEYRRKHAPYPLSKA